ncbi:MAG: DUF1614 domain-containing protein [Terracidiphilus sp.]|nr:DUF1614 domain-containing protein [Terracidiphilus sp.]
MHYFPLDWPFLLGMFLLFSFLVALVEFRILHYAYERMGISSHAAFWILLFTLLGSSINIPLVELPPEKVISGTIVHHHGMRYVVPTVHHWPATVLAINVGGALIPILLSAYLAFKNRLVAKSSIAVIAVALVTHALAQPVRGVGITVPIFIPFIIAVICALILSWRQAGPLAYIGGSMGTLIGADVMNLGKIQGLGAPVASIGGAGTFDGVFLVGIVAVLLASLIQPRPRAVAW